MKKRLLASILSLAMAFSLVPVSALAVDEKLGSTTAIETVVGYDENDETWESCTSCSEDSPHMISSTDDLSLIRTHTGSDSVVTGYFKLSDNIDMEGTLWTPISVFAGSFDGAEYAISNITISADTLNTGFFGSVQRGTIQNLTLKNVNIFKGDVSTMGNVGALCGSVQFVSTTIRNCHVDKMSITGTGISNYDATNIGGLIGYMYAGRNGNNQVTVTECSTKNIIISNGCTALGGLIGNDASYSSSISDCSVTDSTLYNSFSSGWCGGIAGKTINLPYSDCHVGNTNLTAYNAGGIIGYSAYADGSFSNAQLTDCTITALGTSKTIAGLIGQIATNNGSLENCAVKNLTLNIKNMSQANVLVAAGNWGGTCTKENTKIFLNDSEVERLSSDGLDYLLDKVNQTATLYQLNDDFTEGSLIIPDYVSSNGISYPVTTITASAFTQNNKITSLSLGNQLKSIPVSAFSYCTRMTSELVIPDSVTSIGDSAFQSCDALEKIVIGNGVTTIGKHAFNGCTSVTELHFGDSVRTISAAAFANLSSLTGTIVLPPSIASLQGNASYTGTGAFSNCSQITAVIFQGSNASIGAHVFDGCSALNALVVPSNTTFHSKAFGTSSTWFSGIIYVVGDSCTMSDIPTTAVRAITNGGTFEEDKEFKSGELATPTKEGYIFGGWYSNSSFSDSAVTSPVAGQTYYAKWIGMDDMELQYGGTQQVSMSDSISLSDYTSSDTSIATVNSNGTVTATGVGTATISATGTYNGRTATFKATVTVTPRVLTYYNKNTAPQENPGSISYAVSDDYQVLSDLLTFKWKDDPNTVVPLAKGTDINYTYTVPAENGGSGIEGTVDFLPMPAGDYSVKFNLTNPNYTFASSSPEGGTQNTLTISVNVTAQEIARAYLANIQPIGTTTFTYDGVGKLPVTGTLTAYKEDSASSEAVGGMTFNVHIEGLNGTVFHSEAEDVASGTDVSAISGLTLPTKPGAYVMIVSAENDSYYVYKSQVITINKAAVTITPVNKTAYVGDEAPDLSNPQLGTDYTVTGLVGNDTLTTAPTLAYESTPDMSTAGPHTIKASGAAVDEALYTLDYRTGTLTVSNRSSGGSSNSTYAVSVDSTKNGAVTVSPSRASRGTTVTITVKPNDGYELDELTVLDKDGNELKLTDKGDSKYTFTMPSGKVTVEASFVPEADPDVFSFSDVSISAYYYDAVMWAVENGVTAGTSATTFSPDVSCTRAQMVTFLWRAAGSPAPKAESNPFTDLDANAYYYDAVLWAIENGITAGTSATTFSPDATVTRGQTVTFLYRTAGSPAVSGNSFNDVSADAYYANAVAWAVAEGITSGTGNNAFSPDADCTRGQIVTFMYRNMA